MERAIIVDGKEEKKVDTPPTVGDSYGWYGKRALLPFDAMETGGRGRNFPAV